MNPEAAAHITSDHRNRLAVTYVRRATFPITDVGQRNLEYQRAQRAHAYHWGWSPDKVQIIEDIGRSGSGTAHRNGFDMLCGMIILNQVGLVLAADLSRLGHSHRDFALLLELCRRTGTLVAVNGKLLDLDTICERHSTPPQVHENAGSIAYQEPLLEDVLGRDAQWAA